MLVLTRKLQEQIRIGNNITVTILRVKGNSVRVGIEAPRDVRVIRGELPPKATQSPAVLAAETAVSVVVEKPVEESAAEETDIDNTCLGALEPVPCVGREACVI